MGNGTFSGGNGPWASRGGPGGALPAVLGGMVVVAGFLVGSSFLNRSADPGANDTPHHGHGPSGPAGEQFPALPPPVHGPSAPRGRPGTGLHPHRCRG